VALSVGTAKIGVVNQYTYRAEWSPDSGQYVGISLEFPSKYSRAPTAHDAIMGIETASRKSWRTWQSVVPSRHPP
jgi:hypothetical protein